MQLQQPLLTVIPTDWRPSEALLLGRVVMEERFGSRHWFEKAIYAILI
jgi:hypothetical protein